MSSLTVKRLKSVSRYFWLWMSRPVAIRPWSCSSVPCDYVNSQASGLKVQYTVITGHSTQLKMNGPLWSMSWKCWRHYNSGPYGCRRGIQSHCITLSQCTMISSITWMAWCDLWGINRLHGRMTCTLPWIKLNKSCPNITLKWLHRQACFSSLHISSILSTSCDGL